MSGKIHLETIGAITLFLDQNSRDIILAIQTDIGTVSVGITQERAKELGVILIRESGKRYIFQPAKKVESIPKNGEKTKEVPEKKNEPPQQTSKQVIKKAGEDAAKKTEKLSTKSQFPWTDVVLANDHTVQHDPKLSQQQKDEFTGKGRPTEEDVRRTTTRLLTDKYHSESGR
ncbi:MAG: hypothetical protein ACYTEW_17535 [Planctomycetota bacterium]